MQDMSKIMLNWFDEHKFEKIKVLRKTEGCLNNGLSL